MSRGGERGEGEAPRAMEQGNFKAVLACFDVLSVRKGFLIPRRIVCERMRDFGRSRMAWEAFALFWLFSSSLLP